MRFLISDTFTSSLGRLTKEEQSDVKSTAFDLQVNPAHPSMQFHRIERAKDKNFWSVRSGRDLRIIVHKTDATFLLCYVNHHDAAYSWAERRKLQTHPQTGAAQLVEIRETVQEYVVQKYVENTTFRVPLRPFSKIPRSELLIYGVPEEWLDSVQDVTEDSLFEFLEHLPTEAAEALLELATGGKPSIPVKNNVGDTDPFNHPDALRRFKLITSSDELSKALEYPWDKWTIFLHPEQRSFVEKSFNGPARVSGSAGTGKTVVALHRAYNLAKKYVEARVLLSTFSDALASALQQQLNKLIANEPLLGERIEVIALPTFIRRQYETLFGKTDFASDEHIKSIIQANLQGRITSTKSFSSSFIWQEWNQIVDAWQLKTWEQYRSVPRLGRKTRLNEVARHELWQIISNVQKELKNQKLITLPEACNELEDYFRSVNKAPFDFIVVDEAQDISVSQLRFLSAVLSLKPNGLFFSGDLGQRIFQPAFSWGTFGVDIRGRSRTLKINYRTSHEIRSQSDRLLGEEFKDVDGNTENRDGTISVFSGPKPVVKRFSDESKEAEHVGSWLREQLLCSIRPEEMCIIVRSESELERALNAIARAELQGNYIDGTAPPEPGRVVITTMHLAKGLEFRVVVVMACDDEVIPSQSRIENVGDEADLLEVYATERQLLYVACTRARDQLFVSGVEPVSEFLDDFEGK